MDEEVSAQAKVSITIVFLAAFLSSVILVFMNSRHLLEAVQNQSTEATQAVSIQNIVRLQNNKRSYIDLYKTYTEYEPYINSITGKDKDGNVRVHYLRNADNVPDSSSTHDCTLSYSGNVNINNMEGNFLNHYAYETQDVLRVYVYKSKLPQEYEIYYEVLDR